MPEYSAELEDAVNAGHIVIGGCVISDDNPEWRCVACGHEFRVIGAKVVASDHSLLSSYREMLLEHLFAGEVIRHVWLSGAKRLEILKPQVDDGRYDLVLEGNNAIRHVQLKSTFRGSKVNRFNVNTGLALKPSGCVVVLLFEPQTLELGPFLWLGCPLGHPLPDLSRYPIANHTKGNAEGVKLERPKLRVVSRSAFERIANISDLAVRLFGQLAPGIEEM